VGEMEGGREGGEDRGEGGRTEVLNEDEAQNVVLIFAIDGDTREARLVDVRAGLVVQPGVGGEAEHVLNGRHHL